MRIRHTRTHLAMAGTAALALLLSACSLPQAETQSASGEGNPAPVASEQPLAQATGEPAEGSEPAQGEVQDLATDVQDVAGEQATAEPGETTQALDEPTEAPVDDAPAEPLASAQGTTPYALLEIYDLRRVGDTVTLEFAITTDAPVSIGDAIEAFAAGPDLFGGTSDDGEAGPADARRTAMSGVTLADEANRKRHLVLRDASGQCLCTRFPAPVEADTVVRHSAQFPAPPGDVDAMSVAVPRFPVIDTVPLRTAGA